MRSASLVLLTSFCLGAWLVAQSRAPHPAELLLDRAVLEALDAELSGTVAKDHVARLTQLH